MIISKETIEKFKQMVKKHFNQDLSDKEAYDQYQKFLNLYYVVYSKPLTPSEEKKLSKYINQNHHERK